MRHFQTGDVLLATDRKKRDDWMIVLKQNDRVLLLPLSGQGARHEPHRQHYVISCQDLQQHVEVVGSYIHLRLER